MTPASVGGPAPRPAPIDLAGRQVEQLALRRRDLDRRQPGVHTGADRGYERGVLGRKVRGVGGGTIGYPQFAIGYKDDFVVYTVTNSDATQVSRFGDYFSARPIPGSQSFAAEAYDVLQNVPGETCAMAGCRAVARYVEFGRPGPGAGGPLAVSRRGRGRHRRQAP